jgi:hypothetical protein
MRLVLVEEIFRVHRFKKTDQNSSLVEFQSEDSGEYVYLKLDQLKPDESDTGHIRIVLHPRFVAVHRALSTAGGQSPTPWDRSSNLKKFPDRPNTGPRRHPYGVYLEMIGPDASKHLDEFLREFAHPSE